jgi:hypothetical protein
MLLEKNRSVVVTCLPVLVLVDSLHTNCMVVTRGLAVDDDSEARDPLELFSISPFLISSASLNCSLSRCRTVNFRGRQLPG